MDKKVEDIVKKAEAKREELEKIPGLKGKTKYGKVKVLILNGITVDEEPAIAYFATATTATKQKCIDLMQLGSFSKANEMYFDLTIIREESDKRFFMKDNDDDAYFLKALSWCGEHIQYATEYVKKK